MPIDRGPTGSDLSDHVADGGDDLLVEAAVGGDHPAVGVEAGAAGEVERRTGHVGPLLGKTSDKK